MDLRLISILGAMLMCVLMFASCKDDVSETLIAMEKNALTRWGSGDVNGYLDIYAEEITYFDTATEQRIDGLQAMQQRLLPLQGEINIDHFEMINPRVQVHGNAAVLTYNLTDFVPQDDGSLKELRWNSTAVYARIGGNWKIVHSHWAHTQPHDQDIDPDQPM